MKIRTVFLAAFAALGLAGCATDLYAYADPYSTDRYYGYNRGYDSYAYQDPCPMGYVRYEVQCIRVGGSQDVYRGYGRSYAPRYDPYRQGSYGYDRRGYDYRPDHTRPSAGCPAGYVRYDVACVRQGGSRDSGYDRNRRDYGRDYRLYNRRQYRNDGSGEYRDAERRGYRDRVRDRRSHDRRRDRRD